MSFSPSFITWLEQPHERCLIAEVDVKSGGVETTRYLSTVAFRSKSTDTPASTPYRARITACEFTRQLELGSSGASTSSGYIDLDNVDGTLDSWLGDIWAGRDIALYLGQPDWPKSSFELVFSGTIDDITPKSRERLTLKVRDIFGPLNSALSTATVGGTGDNKDALRPIALGECFNIEPVLLDAATDKYAVHLNARVEAVLEVRDAGVPVAYTATTGSGYFLLTNDRSGQVTCDVQGAHDAVGSPSSWVNDVGGLVELVATSIGDGNFLTAGQIDSGALAIFRSANPQPVGLYINDRANRLAVMQQLAAAIGATVTQTYDGKMILVKVGFGSSVGDIDEFNMVDGSFAPVGRPEIRGAIRLNGERNWTPQPLSAIATGVTSPQFPILGDEYVTLSASDATVLSDWKQDSKPTPIETLMVVESDISAEATRLLNLWKVERTIFAFEGFAELLQYEIGDTVTLTHSRFSLSAVSAQIISVTHDWVARRVRLEVLV